MKKKTFKCYVSLILGGMILLSTFPKISLAATADTPNTTPIKEWDQVFGGSGHDLFSSVIQTSDGGYVAVGSTTSSATGEISDTNNGGFSDGLLVKFDSACNRVWDQVFGGSEGDSFSSIIQTIDGGYVAVGRTNSSVTGEISDTNNGAIDGLIVKFDSEGQRIWDQVFGGSGEDLFSSIIQTIDGGYVAVGSTSSSVTGEISDSNNNYVNSDGLLVKFDSAGNKVWDQVFGGYDSENFSSVIETGDGGYVVAGYTSSSASGEISDVNNGNRADGYNDGLLVKFDSAGSKVWDQVFGGTGQDSFSSVIQTTDGGYAAIGMTDSLVTGEISDSNNGSFDGLLVKFDISGAKVWDQLFGGSGSDSFSSIIQIADGGYVVAGGTDSSVSGEISDINNGGLDGLLVKFNSAGTRVWDQVFGGNGYEGFSSIIQTTDGGYLVSGQAYDSSLETGEISDTNNGIVDGLLVKFNHTTPPTIVTQPTNQTVTEGQIATFTAVASGVPAPTVQWQMSTDGGSTWKDIPGGALTTLSLQASLSDTDNRYQAVFTNMEGSITSNSATLTVNPFLEVPQITIQPSNQTAIEGDTATFIAEASGIPTPTIQWQVSNDNGSTWNDIFGATSNIIEITVDLTDSGNKYRAVFTNSLGSVASNSATLTVDPFSESSIIQNNELVFWGSNYYSQASIPPVVDKNVQSISTGPANTVALYDDGTVVAWGFNNYGISTVPAGLVGVKAIAAGGRQTVALMEDGTVVNWGLYGLGTATTQTDSGLPAGLTSVRAIAAGTNHAVALKEDGTVIAWGNNLYGQCTVPSGLTGVKAIAAGNNYTVTLKEDGRVVAWGDNSYGQCTVPAGLSGIKAIAAGGYGHTVALKEDGTVVAWGYNSHGQCTVPEGLTGVIAIAAGGYHTVALKEDGTIVAWGNNYYGQCTIPANLIGVKAIAAGEMHTVVLKKDGTLVLWGNNDYGQSKIPAGLTGIIIDVVARVNHTVVLKDDGTVFAWGLNNYDQSTVPAGLIGVKAIAAGQYHTVALKEDGTVVAWGSNNNGQCTVPAGLTGVKAIACGYYHTVALKDDGTVVAWGLNDSGQSTVPIELTGVKEISAGEQHTVVLKEDGTIITWGNNEYGQCNVPVDLTGVKAIAAGRHHTVALKEDGTVVAWGRNDNGQCTVPNGLFDVKTISAGYGHTVALKDDGTIVAWGDNSWGACSVPTGLIGVVDISAGWGYSIALCKEVPTVIAQDNEIITEGSPVLYELGAFTDSATDSPWIVEINWGDGSDNTKFDTITSGEIADQTHTYDNSINSSYIVTVNVTDKYGLVGSDQFTVFVNYSVSGVTLNTTSIFFDVIGATYRLSETISPSNATNKNVTWKSSNELVATVSADGTVTALGNGTATITVETVDGNKTASCTVNVVVPVTGVTLNKNDLSFTEFGQTDKLLATVVPSNAANQNVTWTSSNELVATVSADGTVTAIGNGTATITVTTVDGNKTSSCTVTVGVSVSGVTLDRNDLSFTEFGQTDKLVATVAPSSAANKSVNWISSDESVATVSADGTVTAIGNGTATITVTTEDGNKTASCMVTVAVPVTGVTLDRIELSFTKFGQTDKLLATVTPSNAANQNVTWTSSNELVATVSADGTVTAVGNGTATITVTTADGNKTASCTVTVKDYSGVYHIRSKKSSLVMDVYNGGREIGTNIIQWRFHGGLNQQWRFESHGNGYYKVTSVLNPTYSLDVYRSGTEIGTNVIQWTYHGGPNQQWKIIENDDGSVSLMSRLADESGTGYILDVYGGGMDEGVNVIQWTSHYGDNQKWYLEPVQDYTINYESNGGSAVASSIVTTGHLLTEPQEPTREGMIFKGWFKDTALTIPWDFAADKMPAEDTTLYANWTKNWSGTYFIRSKKSNLVMDVFGGGTEMGTNIIQWGYHGGLNQQWKFELLGDGYYKITSVLNPQYSLDVYGGGTDLGNRVIQWNYHGGINQQWKIIENEDGSVSFMSRLAEESGTGYLLDVYGGGTDAGVNVIQWTAHYGDNQRWYLDSVN